MVSAINLIPADDYGTGTVLCSPGKKVFGGGWGPQQDGIVVQQSKPNSTSTGWEVYAHHGGNDDGNDPITVWAICGSVD